MAAGGLGFLPMRIASRMLNDSPAFQNVLSARRKHVGVMRISFIEAVFITLI